MHCPGDSIVDFEKVNTGWVIRRLTLIDVFFSVDSSHSRSTFKTLSNIYDKPFLQKIVLS